MSIFLLMVFGVLQFLLKLASFETPVAPAFGRCLIHYWSGHQSLPQSQGQLGSDALWAVASFCSPSNPFRLLFARKDAPLWPLRPKKGAEFWETWDIEIPASVWQELEYGAESGGNTRYSAAREEETLVWAWRRGWQSNPQSHESVIPMGGDWVANLTTNQLNAALKYTREVIERSQKTKATFPKSKAEWLSIEKEKLRKEMLRRVQLGPPDQAKLGVDAWNEFMEQDTDLCNRMTDWFSDKSDVSFLRVVLNEHHAIHARSGAAMLLGKIGDFVAFEDLGKALEMKRIFQADGIDALILLGDPRAIVVLERYVGSTEPYRVTVNAATQERRAHGSLGDRAQQGIRDLSGKENTGGR